MNELESFLFLNRAPKIGCRTAHKLLQHFGSAEAVIKSYSTLKPENKLFNQTANEYFKTKNLALIARDLDLLKDKSINIIHINHPNYPKLLTEIHSPPLVLFTRGNVDLLAMPQISIVGSRNPDLSGKKTTFKFAQSLSSSGVTITSGMALGIDTEAHLGALAGTSSTVAVLGTGIDVVYPAKNKQLAHEIAKKGVLVTEFGANTKPNSINFPIRNRIVSGLTLGTLVVQAKLKSGSLITARLAMEQGREVFAVPGSIINPLSEGCHHLIKQGAKLVETTQDIFSEMDGMIAYAEQQIEPQATPSNNDYKILQYIGYDPTPLDQLPKLSGMNIEKINCDLVYLELDGKIEMLPGAKVQKIQ